MVAPPALHHDTCRIKPPYGDGRQRAYRGYTQDADSRRRISAQGPFAVCRARDERPGMAPGPDSAPQRSGEAPPRRPWQPFDQAKQGAGGMGVQTLRRGEAAFGAAPAAPLGCRGGNARRMPARRVALLTRLLHARLVSKMVAAATTSWTARLCDSATGDIACAASPCTAAHQCASDATTFTLSGEVLDLSMDASAATIAVASGSSSRDVPTESRYTSLAQLSVGSRGPG